MKKDIKEIIKELKKRGIKNPTREEVCHWAIIFLLEDLINK